MNDVKTTVISADRVAELAQFDAVELHIYPRLSFPQKFGKRVKQAGGTYSYARGLTDTRYVNLPVTSADLIDAIVDDAFKHGSKQVCLIARDVHDLTPDGQHRVNFPAWVHVHYVRPGTASATEFLKTSVAVAVQQAIDRNIIN